MLFLISPAKSLDYESPISAELPHTLPVFKKQPLELIEVLREKSPQQISELMSISDKLAVLNVGRYEAFSARFTAKNSRQAVLAFNGDVYEGLNAASLKPRELDWAQEHVVILSGLYGALRPLDLLQPYRLEMGTRLENAKGSNLYQFWGTQIADYLNERSCASEPRPGRAHCRQPGIAGILQGRGSQGAQGPRGGMRFRGLQGRQIQDHQLPCQARARADGALGRAAQGQEGGRPAQVRPGRLCTGRAGQHARQAGVPPQAARLTLRIEIGISAH
jgi:hypothetical protein